MALNPAMLMGAGTVLSGLGGIAGAFGGGKIRTPGFGLTNIDEYHLPALSLLGFGAGGGGWLGGELNQKGLPLPQLEYLRTHNIFDTARRGAERDLPLLSGLIGAHGQLPGFAEGNTKMLQRLIAGSTAQAMGVARRTQDQVMGDLDRVFGSQRESIRRDLMRSLTEIGRQEQAAAAAAGLKTTATFNRSNTRQRQAIESAGDVLGRLADAEAQARAGFRASTGQSILAALLDRSRAGEALLASRFGAEEGLRERHAPQMFSLFGGRRDLEMFPMLQALQMAMSVPVYNAQPVPQANWGDRLGALTGSLGSTLGGLAGWMQGQQDRAQSQQIQAMLLKQAFPDADWSFLSR